MRKIVFIESFASDGTCEIENIWDELIRHANAWGARITSAPNLSTILSRDHSFRKMSRGHWEFVAQALQAKETQKWFLLAVA
jgi:hypothetical protein